MRRRTAVVVVAVALWSLFSCVAAVSMSAQTDRVVVEEDPTSVPSIQLQVTTAIFVVECATVCISVSQASSENPGRATVQAGTGSVEPGAGSICLPSNCADKFSARAAFHSTKNFAGWVVVVVVAKNGLGAAVSKALNFTFTPVNDAPTISVSSPLTTFCPCADCPDSCPERAQGQTLSGMNQSFTLFVDEVDSDGLVFITSSVGSGGDLYISAQNESCVLPCRLAFDTVFVPTTVSTAAVWASVNVTDSHGASTSLELLFNVSASEKPVVLFDISAHEDTDCNVTLSFLKRYAATLNWEATGLLHGNLNTWTGVTTCVNASQYAQCEDVFLTYKPTPNYWGGEQLSIRVNEAGKPELDAEYSKTFVVRSVNDVPVVPQLSALVFDAGILPTNVSLHVPAFDVDSPSISAAIVAISSKIVLQSQDTITSSCVSANCSFNIFASANDTTGWISFSVRDYDGAYAEPVLYNITFNINQPPFATTAMYSSPPPESGSSTGDRVRMNPPSASESSADGEFVLLLVLGLTIGMLLLCTVGLVLRRFRRQFDEDRTCTTCESPSLTDDFELSNFPGDYTRTPSFVGDVDERRYARTPSACVDGAQATYARTPSTVGIPKDI